MIRLLAWYLSGLFVLAALISTFVSYALEAQRIGNIVPGIFLFLHARSFCSGIC